MCLFAWRRFSGERGRGVAGRAMETKTKTKGAQISVNVWIKYVLNAVCLLALRRGQITGVAAATLRGRCSVSFPRDGGPLLWARWPWSIQKKKTQQKNKKNTTHYKPDSHAASLSHSERAITKPDAETQPETEQNEQAQAAQLLPDTHTHARTLPTWCWPPAN